MIEKVIRDGKVATLISPGFGAGWSTWCDEEHRKFALHDAGLVALVENNASEDAAKSYILGKIGEGAFFYTGGWRNIRIKWIPLGTQFSVEEYDGHESLRFRDSDEWETA